MSDQFSFWRDALAGKPVEIHESFPMPGYYKAKQRGKLEPVAIWYKDGELVCRVGKDVADPFSIWTYCADKPIAKELAKQVFETGQWPDMPAEAARSNMPSDPLEALLEEIADKQAQAEALLAKGDAKTEVDANLARNMQKQLLALIARADDMHVAEKAPHLAAGRAVDTKYKFREDVKGIADRLRSWFGAFMVREEAKLKAAAKAKYEADFKAAEAERAKAEAAQAKLMREDPIAALTSEPEALPELPFAPEPVKVQVGGGFGAKAGLKTEWRAHVEDYALATAHFADHPDVKALVEKLATKAVKAAKGAITIPGVKVVEERRAT
jgi:hypothetical protein